LTQVEVVDTVGCGDSFAAAIVAGYVNNHDIPGTLVLANAVGAATATGRGAGTNVAAVGTVRRLLRDAAAAGRHGAAAVASAERLLALTLAAGGRESGNGNGNGIGDGNGAGADGGLGGGGGAGAGGRRRDGEREAAARAA
jgi:hypothetical protein